MATTSGVRTLQRLELFSSCKRGTLKRIDQLGMTLDARPGRTLCAEGAPGAEFFVLVDGLLDVCARSGARALLRRGAWFGETALLADTVRQATVTARTNATVLVYDKRDFNSLLAIAPEVASRLKQTAVRVLDGRAPTHQPWYQPVPRTIALTGLAC
jgi:CRP-like cAMP-binding protein